MFAGSPAGYSRLATGLPFSSPLGPKAASKLQQAEHYSLLDPAGNVVYLDKTNAAAHSLMLQVGCRCLNQSCQEPAAAAAAFTYGRQSSA